MRVGDVAGCVDRASGYRVVALDRVMVRAHMLCWFHVHGEWPDGEIDHRNGVRDDNRLSNLRVTTRAGNQQNVPARGTERTHGGRWMARITTNGERVYLGTFDTQEEAAAAYATAKKKLHPTWEER